MRLFFAVHLSDEALKTAAHLAAVARRKPGAEAYRWVSPHLFHVTLAFLGERPTSDQAALAEVAEQVAARHRPFDLRLAAPGTFGGSRTPRVIWQGLGGDLAALGAFQADLAQRLSAAGLYDEEAHFSPHITLARLKRNARLAGPVPLPSPPSSPAEWTVEQIALVESRLGQPEPTYTDVQRWPLAA